MNVLDAIDRLAESERESFHRPFLAPHLIGDTVTVSIEGVALVLDARPSTFVGYGVFRRVQGTRNIASLVRPANMTEREKYLKLWPAVRLLVSGHGDGWVIGTQAIHGDKRFNITGHVPIGIAEGCQLFDTVIARYDCSRFWFDRIDDRRLWHAEKLREALAKETPSTIIASASSEELGLCAELMEAKVDERRQARLASTDGRIRSALEHSGALLLSYTERRDGYTVRYEVDGKQHTSFVNKELHVHSAGICLSGRDNDFDLASLCSVLREGDRRHLTHEVDVDDDDD